MQGVTMASGGGGGGRPDAPTTAPLWDGVNWSGPNYGQLNSTLQGGPGSGGLAFHLDDYYRFLREANWSSSVVPLTALISALMVLGTAGNTLVLAVLLHSPKSSSSSSGRLVLALAVADLLVCVVAMPGQLVRAWFLPWRHDALCKGWELLRHAALPISAAILVAIAVDRYLLICRPTSKLLAWRSGSVLGVTALLAGVMGLAFGVPPALAVGVYQANTGGTFYLGLCEINSLLISLETMEIYWHVVEAFFLLVLLLLLVTYSAIVLSVWRHAGSWKRRKGSKVSPLDSASSQRPAFWRRPSSVGVSHTAAHTRGGHTKLQSISERQSSQAQTGLHLSTVLSGSSSEGRTETRAISQPQPSDAKPRPNASDANHRLNLGDANPRLYLSTVLSGSSSDRRKETQAISQSQQSGTNPILNLSTVLSGSSDRHAELQSKGFTGESQISKANLSTLLSISSDRRAESQAHKQLPPLGRKDIIDSQILSVQRLKGTDILSVGTLKEADSLLLEQPNDTGHHQHSIGLSQQAFTSNPPSISCGQSQLSLEPDPDLSRSQSQQAKLSLPPSPKQPPHPDLQRPPNPSFHLFIVGQSQESLRQRCNQTSSDQTQTPNLQRPPNPNLQTPPYPNVQTSPYPSLQTPPDPNLQTPPDPNLQTPPCPSLQTPPNPKPPILSMAADTNHTGADSNATSHASNPSNKPKSTSVSRSFLASGDKKQTGMDSEAPSHAPNPSDKTKTSSVSRSWTTSGDNHSNNNHSSAARHGRGGGGGGGGGGGPPQQYRAHVKTAAIFFVVTLTFLASYLPTFLMIVGLVRVHPVLYFSYMLHAALNPILYSATNKKFRTSAARLFACSRLKRFMAERGRGQ